tara:strand:- start:2824 stop:3645 length:822 start_codon:yes stop_codon:yes gene_type:complete
MNNRNRSNTAFTLLETLLAVVIATGLLSTAMYFYQQSSTFRSDLILENEKISSARLIINRISSELRSSLAHPNLNIGLKGESNWVEFLKAEIPSKSSWQNSAVTITSAYPETGYRLIRYELAMKDLINETLNNNANRKMVESLNLDENTTDNTITIKQGDAIDRTERRLLTAKSSTNNISPVKIETVRITDQLKYMQFRYLNNGSWVNNWSGPDLPRGIEISLGIEPLSATNLLEEYTNHVFRRILSIPVEYSQNLAISTNTEPDLEDQSISQ